MIDRKGEVIIKYQWLLEYQNLNEEIELLKWKIKKAELELNRWLNPHDLGKVRINNGSKSANLEEDIKKQKAYLNEKELAMEALMIMINRFEGIDNKIIRMKYIDGMSLETVAEELNYSNSHIYKKHASLVKTIKFIETLD